MTRPLQEKKRFFIALIFIILFFLLIPVVVLYSTGYKLGKDFALMPTGGVYVFYPESGAKVYLDGQLADETSLFARGIFIDKLSSQTYGLSVKKDGYRPWVKSLDVKEGKVSEAWPYLIPEIISTSSVKRFVTLNSGASVTNDLYDDVVRLFATSTNPTISKVRAASTTVPIVSSSTALVRKDIQIDLEPTGDKGTKRIVAIWKGNKEATPFYFCDIDRLACVDKIVVATGDITAVDFYPGRFDVILYSTKEGVFSTELDLRDKQNTYQLLSGNLQFKVDNQRVFIKDKNSYYELLFTASSTLINATSI